MINFYVITAFVECSPNANLSQVSWDSSPWILQHWFVCPAAGAKMNGIIAKPCAVHFISICTSFLLTMWPWAEWGSWFTWGLLIFFCSFVGEQTQSSSQPNFESRNLWCLFAKSCWNINTTTMLRILFSFFVCKIYFLLILSKLWIRREIINTLKMLNISHGMRWCCSFHFR